MRQITSHAGVNLAAANYHYSDKESLYLEILRMRCRQLSEARLQPLNEMEAAAAQNPVPLEALIEIFAAPLLLSLENAPDFGAPTRRLIGRALMDPLEFTAPIIRSDLNPAIVRCGQAMRRHFPRTPPAKFIWNFGYVVGALHHTAATLHTMHAHTSGLCANDDGRSAFENFRQFAFAALRANDF